MQLDGRLARRVPVRTREDGGHRFEDRLRYGFGGRLSRCWLRDCRSFWFNWRRFHGGRRFDYRLGGYNGLGRRGFRRNGNGSFRLDWRGLGDRGGCYERFDHRLGGCNGFGWRGFGDHGGGRERFDHRLCGCNDFAWRKFRRNARGNFRGFGNGGDWRRFDNRLSGYDGLGCN